MERLIARGEGWGAAGSGSDQEAASGDTVSHIKYAVFTYTGGDVTSGGAPHDFDGSLAAEQRVTYGDTEWVVDHLDEDADPPAVWLRPVNEGDLPMSEV
jgi:hypothetical protein